MKHRPPTASPSRDGSERVAPWTPFAEAELPESDAKRQILSDPNYIGTFRNSRYQVQMREYDSPLGPMTWLSIVNVDRSARHDWRDFQRIKNELLGLEREAFEVYPAESRLVDTNNQFHLFVLGEGQVFPIGYAERAVSTDVAGTAHKQRAFEVVPPDLKKQDNTYTRVFAAVRDDPNDSDGALEAHSQEVEPTNGETR